MVNQKIALLILSFLVSNCGKILEKKKKNAGPPISLELIDERELTKSLTKEEECQQFKASLPGDVTRGDISVPHNWEKPEEGNISVFYYGKIFENDKVPVVFFNGGPAGSSHSSFEALKEKFEPLQITMIFIDQRGTGCSSSYPSSLINEFAILQSVKLLQYWGSAEIVKDAEAIRKKLFGEDKKWKVFGQSYGGLIVHRYLEIASASILSAHAHGFAILEDDLKFTIERHLSQKNVGDAFLRVYPEDKIRIEALHSYLQDRTCYSDGSERICGKAAIDGLYAYLSFHSQWPSVHEVLTKVVDEQGNIDKEKLHRLVIMLNYLAEDGDYTHLGGVVISYLEISTNKFDKHDLSGCRRAIEHASSQLNLSLDAWLFSECRLKIEDEMFEAKDPESEDLIEKIYNTVPKKPIRLDAIKQNLEGNKDLKFYLYSGSLDGLVPPSIFGEEVKFLSDKVSYKEFAQSGHDGFVTENEVWDNLLK